jgi:hypothetical protein
MYIVMTCPTEISNGDYIDNRVVLFHSIKEAKNFILDHLGIKEKFYDYINTPKRKRKYDDLLTSFKYALEEFEHCAKNFGRSSMLIEDYSMVYTLVEIPEKENVEDGDLLAHSQGFYFPEHTEKEEAEKHIQALKCLDSGTNYNIDGASLIKTTALDILTRFRLTPEQKEIVRKAANILEKDQYKAAVKHGYRIGVYVKALNE